MRHDGAIHGDTVHDADEDFIYIINDTLYKKRLLHCEIIHPPEFRGSKIQLRFYDVKEKIFFPDEEEEDVLC